MKAAVVRDFAQGPVYDAIELPPAEGAVRIAVLAAALSPRVRSGASGAHYTSSGVLPLVPGVDGVGRMPDGTAVFFVAADDRAGTMAEETWTDPRMTVPLPAGADPAQIAAGMLPAMSAWVALTKRAPLERGQRVMIVGATGTAGQLAIRIAKHLGAGEVIAVGRGDGLAHARELGADHVVALTDGDEAVARVASEVDIVLDYLWGSVAAGLMPAVLRRREAESKALRWVLIGSLAGDELPLSSVMLRKRNLQILGAGQGASSPRELLGAVPAIAAAFADRTLEVAVREVPLAEVATAWSTRTSAGERIVLVP